MEDRLGLAHILVVEDSPADVELMRFILEEAKIFNKPEVISNGQAALDRILRRGAFAQAPVPDIVFLDLNLPGLSGSEILERLRAERDVTVPIVVLTGAENELSSSSEAGVLGDCYLVKPVTAMKLIEAIKCIENLYWSLVSRIEESRPQGRAL